MCETHDALKSVLILAQCFGLFPLNNISKRVDQLNFKYKSWKFYYTLFWQTCLLFCAVTAAYSAFESHAILYKIVQSFFYFHNMFASLILMSMAKKWPKFMFAWCIIEAKFIKSKTGLKKTFTLITTIGFLLALIEHILSELNYAYGKLCYGNGSETLVESYFKRHFPFVFRYFEYSVSRGIFLVIVNLVTNFIWNFVDIFLMLMSTGMANLFSNFNRRIRKIEFSTKKTFAAKMSNLNCWREIREEYDSLSKLCKKLDNILSDLILISYLNNICFILVQLFYSLKVRESFFESLYFFYSFGFLIARAVAVSVFAAKINEESKKPMEILHSVPLEVYNIEINRLHMQIQLDLVALTGHNFFKITKGLVLRIAAAVVTYELVLVQFNQTALEKYLDPSKSCSN